jgi:topoisomerase-4 subunit B
VIVVHLPTECAIISPLFITEGDLASDRLLNRQDVNIAVLGLRGVLNPDGMSKKIVYENEELNLLQAALRY